MVSKKSAFKVPRSMAQWNRNDTTANRPGLKSLGQHLVALLSWASHSKRLDSGASMPGLNFGVYCI